MKLACNFFVIKIWKALLMFLQCVLRFARFAAVSNLCPEIPWGISLVSGKVEITLSLFCQNNRQTIKIQVPFPDISLYHL